jgi:threonine synthase
VDGHGFVVTPFARSDQLSARLGFSSAGGIWVKDETANVSGSHKARHLFGTLLELEVEAARAAAGQGGRATLAAPLAIASCGNAALAAAVVARAAGRPLDVFVPPDADEVVLARLRELGARIETCERRPGIPGDPTYHRLLAALDAGAVPFTCQGNLNGFAIEGGQTLGWELASAVGRPGGPPRLDRLVVQVGGGALASACAGGLAEARALGAPLDLPRLNAVQTRGAFPLARAYERVAARIAPGGAADEALRYAARHRAAFMWPWEEEPRSIAHGILDDETYDWLAVVRAMLETGGGPVIVDEATLVVANELAVATGSDVDETGSAGLAGLLQLVERGTVRRDETVAVLFTGVRRRSDMSASQPAAEPASRAMHGGDR